MQSGAVTRWRVVEVHNFGGFFGGDTISLTASHWDDESEETLTIDEQALANVVDRHHIAPSMVLELLMAGDRVDRAEVIAADEWPLLDVALGQQPPEVALLEPTIRAYRCDQCQLWVAGKPQAAGEQIYCRLCGAEL